MMGDCHKCKYETSAECVPRSQKMGFPKCFQSTITNYDRVARKSPEEMSEFLAERATAPSCTGKCHKDYEIYGELRTFCHDCWLDWLRQEVSEA